MNFDVLSAIFLTTVYLLVVVMLSFIEVRLKPCSLKVLTHRIMLLFILLAIRPLMYEFEIFSTAFIRTFFGTLILITGLWIVKHINDLKDEYHL